MSRRYSMETRVDGVVVARTSELEGEVLSLEDSQRLAQKARHAERWSSDSRGQSVDLNIHEECPSDCILQRPKVW